MSSKQKKMEDVASIMETPITKITPVVQQKPAVNRGGQAQESRKNSGLETPLNAPSGAYQQLSTMGASTLQKSRNREKKDMQLLNERLANYIEKVRFLETQNRKLVADLDGLRNKWGKETAHVKAIYETELLTARNLLDDAEKAKSELELRVQSLLEEIQQLSKQKDEINQDMLSDKDIIDRQNTQLSNYEAELMGLRRRVGNLDNDRRKDKETMKKLQDDFSRCKQDLDNETLIRVAAENDKQSLQEELEFTKNIHEQELKELSALAYRDTTPENREFWKNEMSQCLHDLQSEYDDKLETMRSELESFYNAKLTEFRAGSATRTNLETKNREEVTRLRTLTNEQRGKITDQEATNARLEKLLQQLHDDLDVRSVEWETERAELESENNGLRLELENVLAELQILLDAKLTLELEIAAYRKLLDAEETRDGPVGLGSEAISAAVPAIPFKKGRGSLSSSRSSRDDLDADFIEPKAKPGVKSASPSIK